MTYKCPYADCGKELDEETLRGSFSFDISDEEEGSLDCPHCDRNIDTLAHVAITFELVATEPSADITDHTYDDVVWESYTDPIPEGREFYPVKKGIVEIEQLRDGRFVTIKCECVELNDGRKMLTSEGAAKLSVLR